MKKISVVLPILVTHPWQITMTTLCIELMRQCTEIEFELIIVHTGESPFDYWHGMCENYISIKERTTPTKDINIGLHAANGDYVVYIGNDIMVKPGWLEALLECFDLKDCGIATLAAHEPGGIVGAKFPTPRIIEGMYGPLMMFPNQKPGSTDNGYLTPPKIQGGWYFDEIFESQCADNDLVMRAYAAGLRSYRNNRVIIQHLDGQTWENAYSKEERERITKTDRAEFERRWKDSPLWMAKMIRTGHVIYGKEHE